MTAPAPSVRCDPWAGSRPCVPRLNFDPCVDATAVARLKSRPRVVTRQPVNAAEVVILIDRDRSSLDRDVSVPSIAAEHSERDPRVITEVLEAPATFVHIHQHAPAVPQVPGSSRVRAAIALGSRDYCRIGLRQERFEFRRKRRLRHSALIPRGESGFRRNGENAATCRPQTTSATGLPLRPVAESARTITSRSG